ncbi:MAG: leucine-rich repeat protein [Oscillospiraceae bacterium]|nr:leucine-rich repeat protein [Oscillospiraceae bacterium]
MSKTEIIDGHLWITYTDDLENPVDVGRVIADDTIKNEISLLSYTELADGTYGATLNSAFLESATSVAIPSEFNGKAVTAILTSGFKNAIYLSQISIPDSVTYIGSHAFEGCSNLKSITLPNNLKMLGTSAFKNCTALAEPVIIPESTEFKFYSNVADIGSTTATSYNGSGQFSGCTSLKEVIFESTTIDRIPYGFCQDCTSLEKINIPNSVTEIGGNAFKNCTALPDIILPESLITIGSESFYGCSSLTEITIPANVTEIKILAFAKTSIVEAHFVVKSGWSREYQHYNYSYSNTAKTFTTTEVNDASLMATYLTSTEYRSYDSYYDYYEYYFYIRE